MTLRSVMSMQIPVTYSGRPAVRADPAEVGEPAHAAVGQHDAELVVHRPGALECLVDSAADPFAIVRMHALEEIVVACHILGGPEPVDPAQALVPGETVARNVPAPRPHARRLMGEPKLVLVPAQLRLGQPTLCDVPLDRRRADDVAFGVADRRDAQADPDALAGPADALGLGRLHGLSLA